MSVKYPNKQYGDPGGIFYDSTDDALTGVDYYALKALTDDVTIASCTMANFTGTAKLAGATISKGDYLYGHITALDLTSGTVQLFTQAAGA